MLIKKKACTPSDPDYRSMYENYKQLLNEKTADLQHQMNEFRESIQKKNGDYSELKDNYRKLQESNGAAESELIEKNKEIARLKKQISEDIISGRKIIENQKTDIKNVTKELDRIKEDLNESRKLLAKKDEEISYLTLADMKIIETKGCATQTLDADSEATVNNKGSSEELDNLREELESKNNVLQRIEDERNDLKKVITTMEQTQQSLSETIADKEELINNQRKVIDELKTKADMSTSPEDLKEVRDIVAVKEAEVSSCQDEIQRLKLVVAESENNNVKQAEIALQLQAEKDKIEAVQRRLDDQITITNKTEMALKTQEKLTAAKVDLIENLKAKISQGETPSCSERTDEGQNLTSNINRTSVNQIQDGDGETIPGIEECLVCIKSISLHGVILDGFLQWADTQRRTIASNLWKKEATKHFTDEEIKNAKNRLWEVCGETDIGRLIRRQGQSRKQSEIDDIESALSTLAARKKMPVFLATSSMVMQAPKPNSNISDIQNMEEVIDSVVRRRIDVSDKKHDRAISRTEAGNKKLEDVLKRLESIEKTIKQPRSGTELQSRNAPPPTGPLNPNSGSYSPVNRVVNIPNNGQDQ